MRKSLIAIAAVLSLSGLSAQAAIDNYVAFLYGTNEVGGTGDLDAFGIGSLSIDNIANKVSWSILVNNVDLPVAAAHIHQGAAGANGPVKVDFSGALSGSNLFDADLALITPGGAAGFYVNVHNAAHPGGALRGQLQYVGTANVVPEPETYALMIAGLGAVGLVVRRRRRVAV